MAVRHRRPAKLSSVSDKNQPACDLDHSQLCGPGDTL
jgi:hypothetical protein